VSLVFDLLKKKLNSFKEKLKEKVGAKEAIEPVSEPIEEKPEVKKKPREPKKPKPKTKLKPVEKPKHIEEPIEITKPEPEPIVEEAEDEIEAVKEVETEPIAKAPKAKEEPKRELKAKVSKVSKLKSILSREIEIKGSEISELLWELELSLLEADVEQTTAEEIVKELKTNLVGKKIKRGEDIDAILKDSIKNSLKSMMGTKPIDLLEKIKAKKDKPFKILMLGPNGAGKTTTLAKLTHLLKAQGISVLWSASDTFRAASIEQLEKHAANLEVRVVKHNYGSDPAAVAFDAIKAAKSKNIDVVIIDSAGRQETDKNLMQELQKIVRVAQPDLKIYVGEAFTGQALLHQAQEYDNIAGIDAFVLSKIDCDAKGGTIISLIYKLDKPVIYVGIGQEYADLQKFEPDFVLDRIIG